MKMDEFEGYTYIDGGVCAAKGFRANGLHCGLIADEKKNDLALLVSDAICNVAAVYTTNKVKGAPIIVTQKHLQSTGGKARAVIANSKNANTCNADGEEKAEYMTALVADELQISQQEVLVASTGVIGQTLPIEPIKNHMKELAEGLSYDGNSKAMNAIMTTDTVPKEVAVSFMLNGKTCTLGGMAKGSGMIHPNMATTLNFITTDANISLVLMQKALYEVTKITYNCLSVDGDTSTNDMVCVMANGMLGNEEIVEENEDYEAFKQALYIVMMNMTRMLAKDGEGASKLIECRVSKARDLDTAIIVAKSVIGSPLVKCAVYGEDANCGRILCAIGYAKTDVDVAKIDVDLSSEYGVVSTYRNGVAIDFSEELASKILSADEIIIGISLNDGETEATAWGCDLTYDYVKINGDYRS